MDGSSNARSPPSALAPDDAVFSIASLMPNATAQGKPGAKAAGSIVIDNIAERLALRTDNYGIKTPSTTWMTPFDCMTFGMVIRDLPPLASTTHQ